jgi:uncharacterized protein (DUF58 family)
MESSISALKQQFRTWLFRPKIDSGTVTLTQRRIFIIPTRQGIGFGIVLVVMLLGDVNYNLALGYVLTFLLATVALMTMIHTFRNIARLQVRAGAAPPVFAGSTAQFVFHFHNIGRQARYHLVLSDQESRSVSFDIPAQQSCEVILPIPAVRRGWLEGGRLTLLTEFPLGLYHAWAYLHFDTRCLVYPAPAAPTPLPGGGLAGSAENFNAAGDDDFAGLRGYVAGDASVRIAWKALAREQGLQVKQFSARRGQELSLDWFSLPDLPTEQRLSLLTRWVLEADAQGLSFGLRLPDSELPPQRGATQRAECLRALALFGLPDRARP